jgi:hypothetical protein
VAQADVGKILRDLFDHRDPQLRDLQHVRLVHVAQLASPPAGRFERDPRDAGDLVLVVHHRVSGFAAPVYLRRAARLAEVDAASELAHHQQVDALHDLRLERGRTRQGRKHRGRAQVREQAQLLADAEQAALGARVDGHVVPLRPPHGPEQYGAAGPGRLQHVVGQGRSLGVDGGAADQALFERELQPRAGSHGLQDALRLVDNLGADPVAGEDEDAVHDLRGPPRGTLPGPFDC